MRQRTACRLFSATLIVAMAGLAFDADARVFQDDTPRWHWADYEICGQRSVTREQIIAQVPLAIGEPYETDFDSWHAWADELEDTFGFHAVRIGAVRFIDKNAYLVINIVEQGDEDRVAFREAPTGSVPMPQELVEVKDELEVILRERFESGNPPRENAEKGYLDYNLEAAQVHTAKLAQLAPTHRETLVRIIKEDADRAKRARAATLLNWAGDVEASILEVHEFVDDPDVGVRNNLTRFMLHFLDRLETAEARQAVIDTMAVQLRKPSHADRNKSVSALSMLSEAYPDTLGLIMDAAREEIERIAEQSILSNVAGPAKKLLKKAAAAKRENAGTDPDPEAEERAPASQPGKTD